MFSVRIHGRGGQGIVTAAELLSVAAFEEGGVRPGLPDVRLGSIGCADGLVLPDRRPSHPALEPVVEPDAVIVQDPTLLHGADVFGGLSSTGFVLVNTSRDAADLGIEGMVATLPCGHFMTVSATEIARRHLGRALPNAVLLGGFAALARVVSLEGVGQAIRERFAGEVGARNAAAAGAAYDLVPCTRRGPGRCLSRWRARRRSPGPSGCAGRRWCRRIPFRRRPTSWRRCRTWCASERFDRVST